MTIMYRVLRISPRTHLFIAVHLTMTMYDDNYNNYNNRMLNLRTNATAAVDNMYLTWRLCMRIRKKLHIMYNIILLSVVVPSVLYTLQCVV